MLCLFRLCCAFHISEWSSYVLLRMLININAARLFVIWFLSMLFKVSVCCPEMPLPAPLYGAASRASALLLSVCLGRLSRLKKPRKTNENDF